MATTMRTQSKMVLGYDNLATAAAITAVTLTNCSAASGSAAANLEVEDPSLPLVTTAPTANPIITFQFSADLPTGDVVYAFVNQNFWHNYDLLRIQTSGNGTIWSDIGEVDLKGTTTELASLNNPDLIFRPASDNTQLWKRFLFEKASAWPSITIGNILILRRYELTTNPTTGQFSHTRTRDLEMQRAIGGALHLSRGAARAYQGADYFWTRIDETQAQRLNDIAEVHANRLVGVIAPNQAAKVLPLGMGGHMVGRIDQWRPTPSPGLTATTHLVNFSMHFQPGW